MNGITWFRALTRSSCKPLRRKCPIVGGRPTRNLFRNETEKTENQRNEL